MKRTPKHEIRKAKILEWLRTRGSDGHYPNADCLNYDFQDLVESLGVGMKRAMCDLKEMKQEGLVKGTRLATGVPWAGAPKHIMVYSAWEFTR